MKRPNSMNDYIGQERIKKMLALELKNGFPRSMLLFGNSGLGKTSLGFALSRELANCSFHEYVAQPEWTSQYMVDMLMDLSINGYDKQGRPGPNADKHIVFLDEVHNLKCQDSLLRPIEDGHLFDKHGQANWLPKHTCYILATTNPEKIVGPLRNRLPLQFQLIPYSEADLAEIVHRNFPDLPTELTFDIARRSKGTPRLALAYSDSIHRYGGDAETFFELQGIDEQGLDERDREYLAILREANRPLSLNSISAALRETPAIVRMMESHLLFLGLCEITPNGRQASTTIARGRRTE